MPLYEKSAFTLTSTSMPKKVSLYISKEKRPFLELQIKTILKSEKLSLKDLFAY